MKKILFLLLVGFALSVLSESKFSSWSFYPDVLVTVDGEAVTKADMIEAYGIVCSKSEKEEKKEKFTRWPYVKHFIDTIFLIKLAEADGFLPDIEKTRYMLQQDFCLLTYPGYAESEAKKAQEKGYKNVQDFIVNRAKQIRPQRMEVIFRWLAHKYPNAPAPSEQILQESYEIYCSRGMFARDTDGNVPSFEMVRPYLLLGEQRKILMTLGEPLLKETKKNHKIKYFIPIPAEILVEGESVIDE